MCVENTISHVHRMDEVNIIMMHEVELADEQSYLHKFMGLKTMQNVHGYRL